jgi:hypothetical protein
MNEVDIIKGARKILSDPGRWRKGTYADDGDGCCILGALGMAACNDAWAYDIAIRGHVKNSLTRAADMVAQHTTFDPVKNTAAAFNDDPATTHQDVLDVLDKTLADLGAL